MVPEIYKQLHNANFIIGGDGLKKKLLDIMAEA